MVIFVITGGERDDDDPPFPFARHAAAGGGRAGGRVCAHLAMAVVVRRTNIRRCLRRYIRRCAQLPIRSRRIVSWGEQSRLRGGEGVGGGAWVSARTRAAAVSAARRAAVAGARIED